jgi:hypothetical protein
MGDGWWLMEEREKRKEKRGKRKEERGKRKEERLEIDTDTFWI